MNALEKNQAEEIISLYRAGHSQKDISAQLKITPLTTRKILRENGFETHRFRALNDATMNVILLLVRNGVYFSEIEDVCDISFHAIRDLVARHGLQYESKRVRNTKPAAEVSEGFQRNEEFLERYLCGESFCNLCKIFEFTNDQILNEFLSMERDQIDIHKKVLRSKVVDDVQHNLSMTSIARKHCISMAIVRDILREESEKQSV